MSLNPYQTYFQQLNAAANNLDGFFIDIPAMDNGLWLYNNTNKMANWATFGDGISYNATTKVLSIDYSAIPGTPSIPAAQVNSDWSSVSGVSQILNKPTITTPVNADWNAVSGLAQILNKPSIPADQVQSDWTQASTGAVDYIKNKPAVRSQSPATRSFVSTASSTGFQVSSTRDAMINYSVTIAVTATIAAAAQGSIVLEIAVTNSTTPGDWTEIGRFTNGQAVTLALALQSVQTVAGQIGGYLPAGYYARLRTIATSGTPTNTYNSGQEVLL